MISIQTSGRIIIDDKESNFKIQEFVPKIVWTNFSTNSLWYVQPKVILGAQMLRDFFDTSVWGNDWYRGGRLQFRGFRPRHYTQGAVYSQHHLGNAFDFNVEGLKAEDVFDILMNNPDLAMGGAFTTMEDVYFTPSWTHVDHRVTNLRDIFIVKPG